MRNPGAAQGIALLKWKRGCRQPADAHPLSPGQPGDRCCDPPAPSARWLQLTTLAAEVTPRESTLVFRGWGGQAALDLLTNGRSAKIDAVRAQPAVEQCWLLPKARCQKRRVTERERHWQALTAGGCIPWG